ncbi:transglycosylase family protein [Streptomyces sp. NPDC052095]|uniref:transglycosylase family protein n=1 Tax=unclassified Streptomyces TaxID=2593676 RepID=UPI00344B83A2
MAANGRHRKYQPGRINRASLTVTIGGAGIALPLIAAVPAQAAPTDVWEKVAACESTGNWQINNGNGHFGGLQFTRSTWSAYGGTAYAPRADLATKQQQIAVAEKVLEAQGPGAWPTCSTRAGLTRDGQEPDVAPQSQTTRKAGAGQPSSRPAAAPATPTTVPGKRESYTVARGDSLSAIAANKRLKGGWQHLYERNRDVVGDDPDLILPGQRLSLDTTRASRPQKRSTPATAPKRQETAAPKKTGAGTAKAATPHRTEAANTDRHDRAAAPKRQAAKPHQESAKPGTRPEPARTRPTTRPKPHHEQARPHPKETAHRPALVAPVAAGLGTPYHKPGSWASGYHTGVDFPVPTGTSIRAIASGTVVSAGWGGAYGYQVVIRHSDGKYSQYAHLSALHVREGRHVTAGQRIARSGATGNVTGPHLHFEIRTGPGYGSDVDPLAYLRAGGVKV